MIPACSCAVPGQNPGTSSKVMIGIKDKTTLDAISPNFHELSELSKEINFITWFEKETRPSSKGETRSEGFIISIALYLNLMKYNNIYILITFHTIKDIITLYMRNI